MSDLSKYPMPPRRRRILKDFALFEVSAVDKPAQTPARAEICKAADAPTPAPSKRAEPNPETIRKVGASMVAKAAAAHLSVADTEPESPEALQALAADISKAAERELDRLSEPLIKALGATPQEARAALSETDHGSKLAALAALTKESEHG